ncbi:hypothetical protein OG539_02800 [Actinacidiphila glaucinigra]|uniref:hypothetical protein n=1 Tax=Actinacidiphila glaucinigra TaxID=235986 RepID=UPI003246484F
MRAPVSAALRAADRVEDEARMSRHIATSGQERARLRRPGLELSAEVPARGAGRVGRRPCAP